MEARRRREEGGGGEEKRKGVRKRKRAIRQIRNDLSRRGGERGGRTRQQRQRHIRQHRWNLVSGSRRALGSRDSRSGAGGEGRRGPHLTPLRACSLARAFSSSTTGGTRVRFASSSLPRQRLPETFASLSPSPPPPPLGPSTR